MTNKISHANHISFNKLKYHESISKPCVLDNNMTPCLYHESRNSNYINKKLKLYKYRNSLQNIQIPEIKKYKLQEYRNKIYKNNKMPITGIQK